MYEKELRIAELTVQRACIVTRTVSATLRSADAISKDDNTPVTVGDLAAQALIISAIHAAFPDDTFVGEEDSSTLRKDSTLSDRVWQLVSSTQLDDEESEVQLAKPKSLDETLDIIDLGQGKGGNRGRIWVLDPIDGTATFVRGEQYAVCLCLVEDGTEGVGVLGCPHLSLDSLPISETSVDGKGGYLLSAVRGQGASMRRLSTGGLLPAKALPVRDSPADLCGFSNVESLASTSMNHEKNRTVAEKLGIQWPGADIWSQQMKYVALAVGGHDLMVRIPLQKWHRSAVWDHAGGSLLCDEMGYKTTDLEGKPIDFGAGRRLYNSFGNVVAPVKAHARVYEEVLRVGSGL